MRRLIVLLFVATCLIGPVRAAELQDDLHQRRARFMERLGADSMLILWSAPERVYSNDVSYEFRQDSNFYYLTGIDQPESILVLMPGNRDRKEFLFVLPRDAAREHWEGHRLSAAEATAESGIPTVYLTTEFQAFVESVASGKPYGKPANNDEFAAFFNALRNNSAQVAVVGPPPRPNGKQPESYEYVNSLRARFPGFQLRDVTTIFRDLRQVK